MQIARWWYTLPLRLRSLLRRPQVEQELDEELQFHLEHKIEEGIEAGLPAAEARRRALLAMGGLEQRKEEMRDMRRVNWLTDFLADLRFALRGLRRTPALSAFVVFTLAVGIGMSSMSFAGLDALVFRPYPVRSPSEIVSLVSTTHDSLYGGFSYREYRDLRDRTTSYAGVIAHTSTSAVGWSSEPGATARVKGGMLVSGNFFSVLGVEPQVGRGFRVDEDAVPGRDAVAVLGPDCWKNEFGADPAVGGRKIRLNGHAFTVVGVAPDSFPGLQLFLLPDVYVPLAMAPLFSTNPEKRFLEDRDDRELAVKGRLRSDTTLQQARLEIAALAQGFAREYPELERDRGATVRTKTEMQTRGDRGEWKFMIVSNVLTLGVLLVACTNVAGMLLSRARTRTREIAIRLALGAGRSRLVRLLMTESLVLALLGGLGGIGVGALAIHNLDSFQIPSDLPATPPFQMDLRAMLVCLVVAAAAAVFCGLLPALQSTRSDLVNGLKTADIDLPGRKRLWGRNALVVAQVAASLMLLTGCFVMARGFRESALQTTGFATDHLLMVRLDPRLLQYDAARTQQFYDRLTARAREAPGVLDAALSQHPPLALEALETVSFVPDGFPMPRDRETFNSAMDTVDAGFFDTMAVPILRGRGFLPSDTADAPRVAVVNEQFAKRHWPDRDAVGRRLRLGSPGGASVEIVGVARSIKYLAPTEKPMSFVYMPLPQQPRARLALLVHTAGDPLQLASPMRRIVRTLDANMPIVGMRTYEDLYRYHTVEGPGIAVRMIGTMGAVGVLLAIAGLYGLVSYNVARRTREIGIRMAIGAGRPAVLRLVIGKGLALVVTGAAIGLLLGFAIERMMNSMLFDSGQVAVAVYLALVPSLVLVTMLGALLPALRATRIAPSLALRHE